MKNKRIVIKILFPAFCLLAFLLLYRSPENPIPSETPLVRAVKQSIQTPIVAQTSPDPVSIQPTALIKTDSPSSDSGTASLDLFDAWLKQFAAANQTQRTKLLTEGKRLAKIRHVALRKLIQSNPKAAVKRAITQQHRKIIPTTIKNEIETSFSSNGNLDVVLLLPQPGFEGTLPITDYFVHLLDSEKTPTLAQASTPFKAYPFGALATLPTSKNLALEGITLDGLMAVQARDHVEDNTISLGGGNSGNTTDETLAPTSSWTEGPKTVLYIRVDFSDNVGQPVSESSALSTMSTVNDYYIDMSFGKTSMSTTVTPVIRLPRTADYYKTNNAYVTLMSDARSAARTAGYDTNDYNLDIIAHKGIFGGWAGRGYLRAKGSWLNGNFSFRVTAHELGHNYGLHHASFGSSEYGDPFDVMGGSGSVAGHFNMGGKAELGWLVNQDIQANTSGTYRVHAFDQGSLAGIAGLQIARDSTTNYWFGFRTRFTSNQWLSNGAEVHYRSIYLSRQSFLVDTTPGSSQGKTDSALVMGRTFSDATAGVHVTPIAKGGTGGNDQYIDVVVNLGDFNNNNAPIVSINADNALPGSGETVNLTVTASDPDGDALTYYWEFEDESFVMNSTTASNSWVAEGDHPVTCTVSDMKGGVTTETFIVRVPDSTSPTIIGATTLGNTDRVIITYSESVEQSSAEALANYSVDSGVSISSASLDADLVTVTLLTSTLTAGTSYTLTVNNVRDRANTPNSIAPNTQVTFDPSWQPGQVKLVAFDQNGIEVLGAQIEIRIDGVYVPYDSGTQVQLLVGTSYRVRGVLPGIVGPYVNHTITDTTSQITANFWTATLMARDQNENDVAGAEIKVRYMVPEFHPAGTAVTLPKGYNAQIYGKVPNITGSRVYFLFTDGLAEVNPGFWTTTLAARDQYGQTVSGAEIRVRYLIPEYYPPGSVVTLPKGYNAQIYGRTNNVLGPRWYTLFTDGLDEVDPGFQTVQIHCHDQFGNHVEDGTVHLRNFGTQYYPDGSIVSIARDLSLQTRSRRLSLYGSVYETIQFSSGVDEVDGKFRSVIFRGLATNGTTLVPGAEIDLYNSGIARFPNGTASQVPHPDTIRVRIYKDGSLIADVSSVAIDATTNTLNITTTWVDDGAPNTPPVANNQNVSTSEDVAKAFTLSGSDAENDPLSFIVVTAPNNGIISGAPPNLTYTPDPDFNGSDSITFQISDGAALSNVATVSLSVTAVNDAPSFDSAPDATPNPAEAFEVVTFGAAASDIDGDNLSYAWDFGDGSGSSGASVTHSYAAASDYSVTVTVSDGNGSSITASITVTVTPSTNVAPVANNQNTSVNEDSSVAIVLSASDADNDPLAYSIVSGPGNGSLSGTAPNVTYSPNGNFNGNDSFTFKANDGSADSNIATVSITVNAVNDAPVLAGNPTANPSSPDINQDVVFSASASDIDGDTLSYSWTFGDGTGGSGASTTHPYASSGSFTATVTVTDGNGGSDSASVTVTVTDPSILNPPTNLTATISGTTVTLNWSDNSNNETGFIIERGLKVKKNISWTLLTTVGTNVSSHQDAGLASGTYRYRVKAINATNESGYSNEVQARIGKKGGGGGKPKRN